MEDLSWISYFLDLLYRCYYNCTTRVLDIIRALPRFVSLYMYWINPVEMTSYVIYGCFMLLITSNVTIWLFYSTNQLMLWLFYASDAFLFYAAHGCFCFSLLMVTCKLMGDGCGASGAHAYHDSPNCPTKIES